MKKSILIVLVLLLLLTSCQAVPDDDQSLASTPSSSGSITPPPSSSVVPTTQSTVAPTTPTTQPTVPPTQYPAMTGYAFVYQGKPPFMSIDTDYSQCTIGYFYWVDQKTGEITLISEEAIHAEYLEHNVVYYVTEQEGEYVYYVKAAEPTNIYRTRIGDFSQHELLYESTYGSVTKISCNNLIIRKQNIIQLIADKKYFVVLDVDTGETALVMEQYYMQSAFFEYGIHDTWNEHKYVLFYGKLSEDDKIKHYLYERDTGKVEAEEDVWSDG